MVGLALRGGAALGFAHIGALKWLDEHRVPVDRIAGTSMGGLVAGMYAMDYTPAEMRRLVHGIDWEAAFEGRPPYRMLTFRRKAERRAFPGGLELGLKHGIRFPVGLDPIHPLGLLISRLTFPYSGVHNFDELPIPFRCVAVNMVNGDEVILSRGSLYEALRATIAIPALFTPVHENGMVLADGGMVDNLPTGVVRDMGAQEVVGVDFCISLRDPRKIRSPIGILGQSVTIMTEQNVARSRQLANLVLSADLGRFSSDDYAMVDTLAAQGYQAAAEKAAELEPLALSPAAWQAYLSARRARERGGPYVPQYVEVVGAGEDAAAAVRKALAGHVGRPLSFERLERGLTAIVGWGLFESAAYEKAPDGGLRIRVCEKAYGPPFIHTLLRVNSSGTEDTRIEVPMRLTLYDVGSLGSEWRTDLSIGSRTRLFTEYDRPLGGGWFVAPHAGHTNSAPRPLFENRMEVARYVTRETGAGLDVGRTFGRTDQIRLGYDASNLTAYVRVGEPTALSLNGPTRSFSLRWEHDGQDSGAIPMSGVRVSTEARWFTRYPGAPGGFPQATLDASAFFPSGRHRTTFFRLGLGTSFSHTVPAPQQYLLGGPLRLSAYRLGEFRGDNMLYLSAGYLRRVARSAPPLGGDLYAGAWLDVGSTFGRLNNARYFPSLSIGAVARTPLGPVVLTESLGEKGRAETSFSIGRSF